jgi:hypothetical protein
VVDTAPRWGSDPLIARTLTGLVLLCLVAAGRAADSWVTKGPTPSMAAAQSAGLVRPEVGSFPHCLATFRVAAAAPPAVGIAVGVLDPANAYFARTTAGGLALGRTVDGEETLLAEGSRNWWHGPGEYHLEVLVEAAGSDEHGPAWFLNTDRVPPILRFSARVWSARGAAPKRWTVSCTDDPVIPGRRGEPYWHPDPFATSSARLPFGPHCGWLPAPGVDLVALECTSQAPQPPACPAVEPLLRIRTGDRGGCWLALGDLTGDGRLGYVVARNDNQAVTALTAYGYDGSELWRWGAGGKPDIAYDVPATVHDIDGDGHAEVLCGIRGFVLALDGRTGMEKARWPLPPGLEVADCLVIANFRGTQHPADLLIKSRYDHLWACDSALRPLWEWHGNTGHHPAVRDIDGDGCDEVLCGYALIDHDGKVLWELPLPDHADTTRLTALDPGGPVRAILGCGGGSDLVIASLEGEILHHPQPPLSDFHFQSVHVGDTRPDLPGNELGVDDGWARPGRAQFALFDAELHRIGTFYSAYQRFVGLVEWGRGSCLVFPADALVVDGRGRAVARLVDAPPFGGPGAESPMCRTADVDGDSQDEVILYNAEEIVVYHNPRPGGRRVTPLDPARYRNFTYY